MSEIKKINGFDLKDEFSRNEINSLKNNKADAIHTHDEYALKEHEHDEYALKEHEHDEYALKEHEHSQYSLLDHTHPVQTSVENADKLNGKFEKDLSVSYSQNSYHADVCDNAYNSDWSEDGANAAKLNWKEESALSVAYAAEAGKCSYNNLTDKPNIPVITISTADAPATGTANSIYIKIK